MKKLMTTTLIALSTSAAAVAGQYLLKLDGGAKFEVSQSRHGYAINQVETRFHTSGMTGDQLYKVTTRLQYNTGLDGGDSKSVIESYRTKKSLYDTKAWSLKVDGGDFQVFNEELALVTASGCCGDSNTNYLINAKTGKITVAALDESTVDFEIPNSTLARRYLAKVVDSKAPQKKGTKSYLGSIGYFTADRLVGSVRMYAEVPSGWGASLDELKAILVGKDEIRRHTVTRWSADKANNAATAYNGMGVSTTVYFDKVEAKISIVVAGDQISSSLSKASSEIEMEFVK